MDNSPGVPPISTLARSTDKIVGRDPQGGEQNDLVLEERRTTTRRWWLTRPFLIITITGCFHLGRGAPVDGVIFLATAAALAAAEIREPRPPRARELPASTAMMAVPMAVLVSTWQPGTAPVAVAVAVTGPPMLYLALAKGGHGESAKAGTWWPWAVTGVAICLWELASFLQQSEPGIPNPDHPTLSAVLDPVVLHQPGRAVMISAWLVAGVLLARMMLRVRPCTR